MVEGWSVTCCQVGLHVLVTHGEVGNTLVDASCCVRLHGAPAALMELTLHACGGGFRLMSAYAALWPGNQALDVITAAACSPYAYVHRMHMCTDRCMPFSILSCGQGGQTTQHPLSAAKIAMEPQDWISVNDVCLGEPMFFAVTASLVSLLLTLAGRLVDGCSQQGHECKEGRATC